MKQGGAGGHRALTDSRTAPSRAPAQWRNTLKITASAISLNVDDVDASADFARQHFGFGLDMAADGFVSLSRPDAGFNLIFLRTGLPTFKPERLRGRRADGLLVVFVVDDVDREYARLCEEGVPIATPIETEPWGERYFQVTDPNGVTIQLVQWITAPEQQPA
jgi:catechol 2,3-dioxygenase-like lactoylglutathione lyase family enzyme